MKRWSHLRVIAATAALLALLPACSVRKLAVDRLGDALAAGGSVYASDDDPELVRDAVPFALKTIESLLVESPRHRGLLLAATSGFTQYAFAFVQEDADRVESDDLERAQAMRLRARNLYVRARDYGLRGLDVAIPGSAARIRTDARPVLARASREDVPLLYWTAIAWGSAISLAKDDTELSADLGVVELLMRRAMELDEPYGAGAIHDFYIAWEGGRPAAAGGSTDRARKHLQRALELANGTRAAPLVTFAETASVATQNRAEFEQLLVQALAVDVDRAPEQRLANVIYQRRARWLLSRTNELFLE